MVEAAARSLRNVSGIEACRITVLDDASQQFDVDDLRPMFPPHAEIVRNARNSGRADFAAAQLYRLLLEDHDADIILSLDSDLLIAADALVTLRHVMPHTDGVLSLFNAPNHPAIADRTEETDAWGLVRKTTVGNAGVAWRPARLREVLEHVAPSARWDWDYSRYLVARGVRLLVTRRSLVLHIGFMYGQNSTVLTGDYGAGFADFPGDHTGAMFEAVAAGLKLAFGALFQRILTLEQRVADLEAREQQTNAGNAGRDGAGGG